MFKGRDGELVVSDSGILIRRGKKGAFWQGALRGDKVIPWESIVAVQFKKCGAMVGYFQLSLRGGAEAKQGLHEATRDENTVSFARKKKNAEFAEAYELIQVRINQRSAATATKTCPDCAEDVRVSANVCRFCGYRFG